VAKDHWIRARDFSRYQQIRKWKTQGRVGETAAGLIEIVKPEDRDAALVKAAEEENAARVR
jgi:uncharacterized protein YdbL (DUF1318 family)